MSSELTVRRAAPADAPFLATFAVRTFREAFGHTVAPDVMATYLQDSFNVERVTSELSDSETVFLLATDATGTIAGYAKLYFGAALPEVVGPNPVKLWRLYTASEWQGKGVGTLLMASLLPIAVERGGGTLWLTVNTENRGAIRFYERNGFRPTGFTAFNLGGVIHRDYVMERTLLLSMPAPSRHE